MVYLLIVLERRGRMTRPDGGGLTVEFYKSATTLAREAFGWGRQIIYRYMFRRENGEDAYSKGWSRRREGS